MPSVPQLRKLPIELFLLLGANLACGIHFTCNVRPDDCDTMCLHVSREGLTVPPASLHKPMRPSKPADSNSLLPRRASGPVRGKTATDRDSPVCIDWVSKRVPFAVSQKFSTPACVHVTNLGSVSSGPHAKEVTP
eukprot:scaffold1282_cov251-Pinguiococcus_pyrenoidosus.AAC.47